MAKVTRARLVGDHYYVEVLLDPTDPESVFRTRFPSSMDEEAVRLAVREQVQGVLAARDAQAPSEGQPLGFEGSVIRRGARRRAR